MGDFTTSESDRNLNLVAAFQELYSRLQLGVKIMVVNIRGEANLLNRNNLLIFAVFLFPLCKLKLMFSIVHNLADGGLCLGSNLNQIKIFIIANLCLLYTS